MSQATYDPGSVGISRPSTNRGLDAVARYGSWVASAVVGFLLFAQMLAQFDSPIFGIDSWRNFAIALVIWFVIIDFAAYRLRGLAGQRLLFLLPALQITLALVIFPTFFGLFVAFTEWDLSGAKPRSFNGLENFRRLFNDEFFWNALINNFQYVFIAVPFQYAVAFGIALLLNQHVRGLKFFRVIFLLPFMMSPVAVGWMVGRSILDANRGVVPALLEKIGIEGVSFFDQQLPAFLGIVAMDSWISIPFMMVMLLAGLQAMPTEVFEAAEIDGATSWQRFRDITFPLMLPVSLTAIILRTIFEFKLVDIVRVVTAGGPGGATDTLSLYIYREGIESTNVGYATAMAMVFLVVVIVFTTILISILGKRVRDVVY